MKGKSHPTNDLSLNPSTTPSIRDVIDRVGASRRLGTINNCAHDITPWGTYLSCEENFNGNFGGSAAVDTSTATETGKLNRRYGLSTGGFGYRWHTTDPRFDLRGC